MRTFFIIWIGQLVSALGSQMTLFALTVWTWERTGSATALALIGFCVLVSGALATPLVGIIVDRWNRRSLMILGDTVTALAVFVVLILNFTGSLQVWHLYAIAIFIGPFSQLQALAYQASLSLIVPERHHTRVSSMGMVIFYSSQILSPALAGVLYPIMGLTGIMMIDLITFAIAVLTLLSVRIPQRQREGVGSEVSQEWEVGERSLTFGFRYILNRPSLFALLIVTCSFWFAHELADTLVSPMILARTDGNTAALGSVSSAAGIGGVIGAIAISLWGGSKRRIQGLALGMIGVGISRIAFGLGRSPMIWLPTQFSASLHFPLFGSAEQAIWLANVESNLQGRVFAINLLSQQVAIAIAMLIAGPLADYIFESAMMPSGILAPVLGKFFGTGSGAGIAVLFEVCAWCMVLIGIGSYAFPALRNIENTLS